MTKLSRTWWDRLLFRDKGIVPTKRLILLFGLLGLPIAIITIINTNWRAFIIINLLAFLISLFDYFRLPRSGAITCHRESAIKMERGQSATITLQLRNDSKRSILFKLIDHLPSSFSRPFPIEGELIKNSTLNLSYVTIAAERGNYSIDQTSLKIRSTLGLWQKQLCFRHSVSMKVIPDMTLIHQVLGSLQPTLTNEGARIKKNQRGTGEFAHVRAYAFGDDPRKMNWRQSGKLAELMTNVYEPEHGKQITLLLDCGRIMGVELKEVNRLERSIEALLTVAAGALSQGDYVSVLAFSNKIKAYVPPGKGLDHFKIIVEEIYHLKSDHFESNFATAITYLNNRQRKRSLLMMFSDMDSFLYDESIWSFVGLLKRRHFLFILSIGDPILEKYAEKQPKTLEQAFMASMAELQLLRRHQAIKKWSRYGQTVMEVPEKELAIAALSRYIDVINRDVL